MSDSRKIVRIFLGSPGDLSDERLIAKSVVDAINSLFADSSGYHIELVGWEETVSSFGRPQALISNCSGRRLRFQAAQGRGRPSRVRRMASMARIDLRRAVSTTDRISA